MSQTLTKPVMLDETGQDISSKINGVSGKLDTNGAAIVSKLNDIKEAIGSSSEFIPIRIDIATPPVKTSYMAGDTLDLTGIAISLVATNGTEVDVTSECTFIPANGATLTGANKTVTVSYYYYKDDVTFTATQAITVKELASIAVTTPPTKTAYKAGETLDLTGIGVMATYDDGSVASVTSGCVYSPADGSTLSTSDLSVSISFTEGGVTKTTSQAILVKEVSSIAITTVPTKTEYVDGDELDLTGMVVTATYSDGSTDNVTDSCTFSPADGAMLSTSDTTVTATFAESGLTKTATQAIIVNIPIYGVEWDGTATTAWTRTDLAADFEDPNPYYAGMTGTPSSPFDNVRPWSQITVIEDETFGTLVRIPKFWYKLTKDGSKIKIQISSKEQDGYSVSPAHMDRRNDEGTGMCANNGESDYVYVGRYFMGDRDGYQRDTITTTGVKPVVSQQRYYYRNALRNKCANTDYIAFQMDFATLFTIWLLYLVEFADWDSQKKIGYGGGTGNSSDVRTNGSTDQMPYHTGTMQTSRNTYGAGTQYRHLESMWDSYYQFVDGCFYFYNSPKLYLCIQLEPSDFKDQYSALADYQQRGVAGLVIDMAQPSAFNISNVAKLFPLLYPSAARFNTSDSEYSTDYWETVSSNSYPVIYTGQAYGRNTMEGLFNMRYCATSNSDAHTARRVTLLPRNS